MDIRMYLYDRSYSGRALSARTNLPNHSLEVAEVTD